MIAFQYCYLSALRDYGEQMQHSWKDYLTYSKGDSEEGVSDDDNDDNDVNDIDVDMLSQSDEELGTYESDDEYIAGSFDGEDEMDRENEW
jgi:hypothetical protein